MNLLDRARLDAIKITTNLASGFAKEAIFTAPTSETATVNVLYSEHNLSHDMDGSRVNSKNSHITVAEQVLIDAGYPYKNAKGEINLANLQNTNRHRVQVESINYYIRECYPSKTTGLIVLILNTTPNG